ncbi:Flagellar basal body rod protein FlgB [bioreactor metagenome]|uniref:Flagellar basal body rod protein FlgB n=1 Tax=bioreactor metagenome TaxID=1076179 RepID=A0A644YCI7_9ZZZZ
MDTPGFKASQVKFESLMASALGEGESLPLKVENERHMGGIGSPEDVEAEIETDRSTAAGMDDNNVDVESEMASLAKNSIEYYTLVNKVNSEFRKLDKAISVT